MPPGDELIEVDGTAVSSPEQCTPLFAKHVAGETIKLKVHRGTEIPEIEATLGARD